MWGEGEEWAREKEPDSITVNDYGIDRFTPLLHAIGDRLVPGGVVLTGVRAEESPARRVGLVSYPAYKWVTWGTKKPKNHVILHPLYDWYTGDIWKTILDGGWDYNEVYDYQYRYGVSQRNMRVSNYHHETALETLNWLQEVEPQTWEKATQRVAGISTVGHFGTDDLFVHTLPFMFQDWEEYRDYLIEKLPATSEDSQVFREQVEFLEKTIPHVTSERRAKAVVQSVLANDLYGTKVKGLVVSSPNPNRKRRAE